VLEIIARVPHVPPGRFPEFIPVAESIISAPDPVKAAVKIYLHLFYQIPIRECQY